MRYGSKRLSGTGKTTLLHLIAGITLPQRGRIVVGDTEVSALGSAARREFRIRNIGLVFQIDLRQQITRGAPLQRVVDDALAAIVEGAVDVAEQARHDRARVVTRVS